MTQLDVAPIDYLALEFPGAKLEGEGLAALVDLTDRGIIRILDLMVAVVAEDGSYGEIDTGTTTLSFASHEMGRANLPGGFVAHDPAGPPVALEIALVDDDVPAAHARAVEAGARELAAPKQKPWGQTVSYVRDPNGVLIELCSPMA